MAEEIMGRLKPDPFVVPWLMQMMEHGASSEVFAAAHAGNALPRGFSLTDFAGLVRSCSNGGSLTRMRRARSKNHAMIGEDGRDTS